MARIIITVFPKDGFWHIDFGGRDGGQHDSQDIAKDIAVRTAHNLARDRKDSQVMIKDKQGRFRTEWTYGKDPFPPRG